MSENLQILLLSGHILLGICLISIILIQRSKGSDMGAAFGGGASDTVFGARGSATFLSRTTAILATLFFASSLALAYIHRAGGAATTGESVFDGDEAATEIVSPAFEPTDDTSSDPLEAPEFEGLDLAPAGPADVAPTDVAPAVEDAAPEAASDSSESETQEEPQGE